MELPHTGSTQLCSKTGEEGRRRGRKQARTQREWRSEGDNMEEWKENKEKGVGDATRRNRGDKRRDKVAVKGETVS